MNLNDEEWWIDYLNQRGLALRNSEGMALHKDMYDIISEASRREREEIVKMVEGLQITRHRGFGYCEVCSHIPCTYSFYNKALQDVINAIKERK